MKVKLFTVGRKQPVALAVLAVKQSALSARRLVQVKHAVGIVHWPHNPLEHKLHHKDICLCICICMCTDRNVNSTYL
jgi:hypothetical protein